jgi:hypothetical protein
MALALMAMGAGPLSLDALIGWFHNQRYRAGMPH